MNDDIIARFWFKVITKPSPECWLWTGSCSGDGYGAFKIAGVQYSAHRVSYEIAYGPIPEGMQVLHHCDTPLCVRPDHLFLGTCADNMADKARKLRSSLGERNPKAKLTEADVIEIRQLVAHGAVQRHVAKQFNIGYLAVHRIVHRQTWRHVA